MTDYSHLKPLQVRWFPNPDYHPSILFQKQLPWICDKDGNRLFPLPLGYNGDVMCWMIREVNRD